MSIDKWDDRQLSFNLDLDDVVDDAQDRSISQADARKISEAARGLFEGRKDLPSWWKDYLALVEKGWPWRIACYMAWASSPKTLRKPDTLQELSTSILGLTGPRVIYTWRKKHPTIDTVIAMLQAAPLWEHRRDVLEALVEMAKTPDYKAFNDRKLFLEMIGDYTPKSKLELGRSGAADDIVEKSDEELRRLIGDPSITEAENASSSQDAEEDENAGE